MLFRGLCTSVLLILIINCTTTYKRLSSVSLGVTKRQMLHRFGDPLNTYRKEGKDHWVYESLKEAKTTDETLVYKHVFIFLDGVLIDKTFTRSFTKEEIKEFKEN